jgi:hypothetical protein
MRPNTSIPFSWAAPPLFRSVRDIQFHVTSNRLVGVLFLSVLFTLDRLAIHPGSLLWIMAFIAGLMAVHANFFAALYLHYLAIMNHYLHRPILDIGDRTKDSLPDIAGDSSGILRRQKMLFFHFGNFYISGHLISCE